MKIKKIVVFLPIKWLKFFFSFFYVITFGIFYVRICIIIRKVTYHNLCYRKGEKINGEEERYRKTKKAKKKKNSHHKKEIQNTKFSSLIYILILKFLSKITFHLNSINNIIFLFHVMSCF